MFIDRMRALVSAGAAALLVACGGGGGGEGATEPAPRPGGATPVSDPPFTIAGFNINMYGRDRLARAPDYRLSLDRLAATGSNTVMVTTPYFQSSATSADVGPDPDNTETDAHLSELFDALRERGLAVAYKFTLIPKDGTWSGAIAPSDSAAWFKAYKTHLVRLAALSQAHGVKLLYIANEMQSMASPAYASQWNDVVDAVRTVYSGQLSWNAVLGANAFPHGEAFTIPVTSRLDHIGLSVYEPLTAKADPSVGELMQAWHMNREGRNLVATIKALHQQTGKPIVFSEITYRSVDGNNVNPADWTAKPTDVSDPQEQADTYEAFMRVWTQEQQDWVLGVLWWQWMIEPNPARDASHDQTPQNLPAEALITRWFSGQVQAQSLARLEIVNRGLFLQGIGQTSQLSVKAFNRAGTEVDAGAVSWSSDAPDKIEVSATGALKALVPNGSAQITAKTGSISSGAVLATVASVATGVRLVPEEVDLPAPVAVDPLAPYDIGMRFVVTLPVGMPAVQPGELLVNLGNAPFVGRVVSVGVNGRDLTLEVVSPLEAFPGLDLRTRTPLRGREIVLSDPAKADLDLTTAPDGTFTVRLKPGHSFTLQSRAKALSSKRRQALSEWGACEASSNVSLTLAKMDYVANISDIALAVDVAGRHSRFIAEGPYTLNADVVSELSIQGGGEVDCNFDLGFIRVKVPGPLGFIVGGVVPFGLQIKAGVTIGSLEARYAMGVDVEGSIKAGLDCAGESCDVVGDVRAEAKPRIESSLEASLSQHGYTSAIYPYIKVKATPAISFKNGPSILITKTKIGLEIDAELASAASQALDGEFAASYQLQAGGAVSSGDTEAEFGPKGLRDFMKRYLNITLIEYSVGINFWSRASPTGQVGVGAKPAKVGDPFDVRVALDPKNLTIPGIGNVTDEIQLHLQRKDGTFEEFPFRVEPVNGRSFVQIPIIAIEAMLGGTIHAFAKVTPGGLTLFMPLELGAVSLDLALKLPTFLQALLIPNDTGGTLAYMNFNNVPPTLASAKMCETYKGTNAATGVVTQQGTACGVALVCLTGASCHPSITEPGVLVYGNFGDGWLWESEGYVEIPDNLGTLQKVPFSLSFTS